jgi:Spy/CpxP family protein refolding chaperone
MKLTKALAVMVAGLMVVAVVFAAEARPFGPNPQKWGMRSGFGGLKAFLELKLSEPQQMEMMNIITKYQSEREDLRNRMIGSRKSLKTVLHAENFNEDDARKAFREASTVREEIFVLRAKMMAELKAVLTPEQLELLKERRAQKLGRMKHCLENRLENPSE